MFQLDIYDDIVAEYETRGKELITKIERFAFMRKLGRICNHRHWRNQPVCQYHPAEGLYY